MDAKTATALDQFVATAQAIIDEHYAKDLPNLTPEKLTVEVGRRYAKVIRGAGSQRSVHCFVDLTNGDVLKAASWKAPAKHARGSIFTDNHGKDALTPYGAHYLA